MRESAARSRAGWSVIGGATLLFVGYTLVHLLEGHGEMHEVVDLLGGAFTILCLGGMVAFAYGRAREREVGRDGWLFCRWFVGGVIVLGAAAGMTFAYEETKGALLVEPVFSVVMWAAGGGATGLLIGHVDARRRAARASAENAREDAQRLAQQLSVINRVLRHDVRTDLNVVLGYADEVGRRFEEGEEPPELERVRERARRLVGVAEQARVVEGLLEDERVRPIAVGEYLASRLTELRHEHPDVDVSGDVDEDAVVHGHRLVELALDTVLDTALDDVSAVTSLDVACRVVDDGETVEVVVCDDGPGIPAGARVVARDEAETPLEHADGIGLWVVKWAVERSDGSLDFEDEPTSRIRIRLPAESD